MPIHRRSWRRTPTLTSAATPRAASARMTTTDQRPLRGFHWTVWVPAPDDEATQKRCDAGGCGVWVPGIRSYWAVRSPWWWPTSRTRSWPTPRR